MKTQMPAVLGKVQASRLAGGPGALARSRARTDPAPTLARARTLTRQHGSHVRACASEIVITGSTSSGELHSRVLTQCAIASRNSRFIASQRASGCSWYHATSLDTVMPEATLLPSTAAGCERSAGCGGCSWPTARPPCSADSSTSRFTSKVARRAAELSEPGASSLACR